jgi:hypothetical protein
MSEVSQRDFATFQLGDDVYKLAYGVIPEIADYLDVDLGTEPNTADLQTLMGKVGKNKVTRNNAEITAITRDVMADILDEAGTQKAINRSLWTQDVSVNEATTDDILLVICVANWQDRAAKVAADIPYRLPVHLLAGMRVMDSPTEKTNENITRLSQGDLGRYPREAEYAAQIVMPKLLGTGYDVYMHSFDSTDGDELFQSMFASNPELTKRSIAVVRNANAGIVTAVQMRNAAKKVNPDFDSDPTKPQALVADGFTPARTDAQEADSANYQKPSTGLRQLVLTALKLHEAAGGE